MVTICSMFEYAFILKKSLKFPYQNFLKTSITLFLFLLFPKLKKLNISVIYNTIILIFSVNLPMIFIYKFWFNPQENLKNITLVKIDQNIQAIINFILEGSIHKSEKKLSEKKLRINKHYCWNVYSFHIAVV